MFIDENLSKEELRTRISSSIDLIVGYGGIDGSHHKDWCLDQTLRLLVGDKYDKLIESACNGVDGPNTYEWNVGIPP